MSEPSRRAAGDEEELMEDSVLSSQEVRRQVNDNGDGNIGGGARWSSGLAGELHGHSSASMGAWLASFLFGNETCERERDIGECL